MPLVLETKELEFSALVARNAKKPTARRVQEWLCLNRHGVVIDGDFGPATEAAVRAFCKAHGLPDRGSVSKRVFEKLSAPMRRALHKPRKPHGNLNEMVVAVARQHLEAHPREVGGNNRGPWVRLYMKGRQGKDQLWCAGFVSFVICQASKAIGLTVPFPRTVSCDTLAKNGCKKGLFVAEKDVSASMLAPGTVFLKRESEKDWTHTGFVIEAWEDAFQTIEGNASDEGFGADYEVCSRIRGYKKTDFVLLSGQDVQPAQQV